MSETVLTEDALDQLAKMSTEILKIDTEEQAELEKLEMDIERGKIALVNYDYYCNAIRRTHTAKRELYLDSEIGPRLNRGPQKFFHIEKLDWTIVIIGIGVFLYLVTFGG